VLQSLRFFSKKTEGRSPLGVVHPVCLGPDEPGSEFPSSVGPLPTGRHIRGNGAVAVVLCLGYPSVN